MAVTPDGPPAGNGAVARAGTNDELHPARRLPSLRVLVTLIVVLPIAAAAMAMLVISDVTSGQISEQLGEELVADATARVTAEVRNYIGQAVRLSDLYARRLQTGKLSATDLTSWEQVMFDDLATSPYAASICFGNPAGDAVYLQRAHGRLEYGVADGAKDCAAMEWPARPDGTIERNRPIRAYRYDPRQRPWYTAALNSPTPVWTPVYFWFGDAGGEMETGSGYTRTVTVNGELAGVLTIDVTLGAVSDFLRRQPFASRGDIFVVDDLGLLVAASDGAVVSAEGKRLPLASSESRAARAVAAAAPQTTTAVTAIAPAMAQRNLPVEGDGPSRASVTSFTPYPGAEWRIITVLPESAFLSQAQGMRRRSILLAGVAVLGAMAIGVVFSRRLSTPLIKLSAHVARIGGGDFNTRLHLDGARELQQLAVETNRMAGGLRQRLELEKSVELATHVQQSLLPQHTPEILGLDLFGHSRYCESTGGDYLDFIDVANLPNDRAFIAVGDVMGHGLGAALLMATARAAVRTSATLGAEDLGGMMRRVNDVLARDARHGLFMTLMLLIVEPQDCRVRWANAGHDPAILYDPARDEFGELQGADVVLGVEEGLPYENFSHTGLTPGTVMFIGTDGVWEARRTGDGDMYGKDRIREVMRAHANRSASEISVALEHSLDQFVGSGEYHDDVTFVMVKFVGCEAGQVDIATRGTGVLAG